MLSLPIGLLTWYKVAVIGIKGLSIVSIVSLAVFVDIVAEIVESAVRIAHTYRYYSPTICCAAMV